MAGCGHVPTEDVEKVLRSFTCSQWQDPSTEHPSKKYAVSTFEKSSCQFDLEITLKNIIFYFVLATSMTPLSSNVVVGSGTYNLVVKQQYGVDFDLLLRVSPL